MDTDKSKNQYDWDPNKGDYPHHSVHREIRARRKKYFRKQLLIVSIIIIITAIIALVIIMLTKPN